MEANQKNTEAVTQQTVNNKKMMSCKTCGAPMAKSAKKCQACGAKNPKKRIKKLIALFIILAIIIGYPAFFIIRDRTSATITALNGEKLTYSELSTIYNEHIRNDDYKEFVEEYLPAKVVVKGKVTEIDTYSVGVSTNGFSANVEAGACNIIEFEINNEYIYAIPYDLYTDEEDYSFGKLKVGDKVEATGIITKAITLKDGNYIKEGLDSVLEIVGSEDGIIKK